jgi:hypothetical protein
MVVLAQLTSLHQNIGGGFLLYGRLVTVFSEIRSSLARASSANFRISEYFMQS